MFAYFRLINVEPMDHEIRALKKLDSIAMRHSIDQMKKKKTTAKK